MDLAKTDHWDLSAQLPLEWLSIQRLFAALEAAENTNNTRQIEPVPHLRPVIAIDKDKALKVSDFESLVKKLSGRVEGGKRGQRRTNFNDGK
jgi:hypothetical protein